MILWCHVVNSDLRVKVLDAQIPVSGYTQRTPEIWIEQYYWLSVMKERLKFVPNYNLKNNCSVMGSNSSIYPTWTLNIQIPIQEWIGMEQRRLGKTDKMVSVVNIGGCGPGYASEDKFDDALQMAIDAGVNMIDCAPTYGEAEHRLRPLLESYRCSS